MLCRTITTGGDDDDDDDSRAAALYFGKGAPFLLAASHDERFLLFVSQAFCTASCTAVETGGAGHLHFGQKRSSKRRYVTQL